MTNGQEPDNTAVTPPPATRSYPRPPGRQPFSIVGVLIMVNVVVFVLQRQSPQAKDYLWGLGAMQALAVFKGQIWRLFTAQYLHANYFHLLVNMIALYFLGRPLEERWSTRRFFAIYTACGLAGNIFYAILGWRGVLNPLMPAVGASGCIYGLLGIVAILFPRAVVLLFFVIPLRIRTAAIILGLIAFMTVVERGENYGGQACHLAGLAFGVWWAVHGDQWWESTEWIFAPRRR